jgi:Na+-driven multidrug efflux pump
MKHIKKNELKDKLVFEGGAEPKGEVEDPENFGLSGGMAMIAEKSVYPIIGMLFHPSYMLVNAKLLGQVVPDASVCPVGVEVDTIECVRGEQYLAAFGLASSTIGIILLAPGICFALGILNVVPQANGSGEYKLCGAYLNRMLICLVCLEVPVFILLEIFAGQILGVLGQDKWVTDLATEYIRIVAPGVVMYHIGSCFTYYCNGMGKT